MSLFDIADNMLIFSDDNNWHDISDHLEIIENKDLE